MKRGIEAKLRQVRALREGDATPAVVAGLRDALGDRSNLLAAEAAELVGARGLVGLGPDLVAAFHRFMIDPGETDAMCRAKIAIVEALNQIEYEAEELFRVGLRHVQAEPRWGGRDDAAAPLRAVSAFALVRLHPRDLVLLLADLLADPEKVARVGAARALGAVGSTAAIPLLRYKARAGDPEPEVVTECLIALMSAEPAESLSFVGEFLESSTEEIAEGAALALGESRRPEAFAALKAYWPRARSESLRNVLLLAIAITRVAEAMDFLVEVLARDKGPAATAALEALAIHRHNPAVRDRVAEVVENQGAGLKEKFAKVFRKVE